MDFTQWLTANGYDAEKLTPANRKHLEAAWKLETEPPPAPAKEESGFDEKLKLLDQKAELNAHINRSIEGAISIHAKRGDLGKLQDLKELRIAAIEDPTMTQQKFDLAMLRLERRLPPMEPMSGHGQTTPTILEAAMCAGTKLPGLETKFDAQTLQAAHEHFPRGLGLQELLRLAAERNGNYRGSSRDLKAMFRAAIPRDEMYAAGGWGPSTISVPNILANVANKYLFVGFNAVDSSWRQISAIRAVNDYKQISTVALTGDIQFKELPPAGEIKHSSLGEIAYTNQATIYARMIGIDQRDIRNDDAGAFSSAAQRVGRGGALGFNDKFWSVFMNNSSFFSAGNNNVITGATSVLSGSTGLEALRLADAKFRDQTDPDGKPLGVYPTILLVPNNLRISALNLMNSTTIVGTTTADSMRPDQNAFAGAYSVVTSPYLNNTAYTGNSTTAWYLIAPPADMPVIQAVFVDGIDTPMVETTDADFNMLGIAMRGTLHFGVALQEFRGGLRAAGA